MNQKKVVHYEQLHKHRLPTKNMEQFNKCMKPIELNWNYLSWNKRHWHFSGLFFSRYSPTGYSCFITLYQSSTTSDDILQKKKYDQSSAFWDAWQTVHCLKVPPRIFILNIFSASDNSKLRQSNSRWTCSPRQCLEPLSFVFVSSVWEECRPNSFLCDLSTPSVWC